MYLMYISVNASILLYLFHSKIEWEKELYNLLILNGWLPDAGQTSL